MSSYKYNFSIDYSNNSYVPSFTEATDLYGKNNATMLSAMEPWVIQFLDKVTLSSTLVADVSAAVDSI